MIVYLLDFKQYGDRLAKKFDTIDEYDSYVLQSYDKIEFNKNDGIVAKQILNTDTQANYFIVCDDEDNILSRWYITEAKWIRNNQTQYVLYRDLLADYQDIVKNSTCKINRAMLEYNDPLIFNSEGINVNQIKKSETLLKDSTGVPWLVAYVDRTADLSESSYTGITEKDITPLVEMPLFDVITNNGVDHSFFNYPGQRTFSKPLVIENNYINIYVNKKYNHPDGNTDSSVYKYTFLNRPTNIVVSSPDLYENWEVRDFVGYCDSSYDNKPSDYKPYAKYDLLTNDPITPTALGIKGLENIYQYSIDAQTSQGYLLADDALVAQLDNLYNNPGKIYRYYKQIPGERGYWTVKYKVTKNRDVLRTLNITSGNLYNSLNNRLSVGANRPLNPTGYTTTPQSGITLQGKSTTYTVELQVLTNVYPNEAQYRNHNANGLYDMFCTPYADTTVSTNNDGNITVSKSTALLLYQNFAEYNKDAVYDIQILPFCPVPNYRLTGIATDYQLYTYNSQVIPMLNIPTDSSTFDIPFVISPTNNNKLRKQRVITDFYRLCDPGYNGVFEFNSEKNEGVLSFNVDMTLKPFSPFIHLNPNFGGLYGQDFNDARGLICGSNFSISTISNRFAEYEMNNKNWQQMFNRQIQNLEFTQGQERINSIVGAVTGTIQGGAMGASIGSSAGPIGAVVGGVAGGVISGIGGIADLSMMESRQNEQRAYMKDMHNYQIDNIKALPDALTRVTTMNNIYKYFPFLEYYSCTDEEKTVVNNWINWYSMTVNAIGTVNSYIKQTETFISATPLRSLLADDSHVDNALQREMEAGFFI